MWKKYFAFALAAAAAVTLSDTVSADPPQAVQLCGMGTADANLTLGVGVNRVTSTSPNTSYGSRPTCPRYKTDITVPHNSSPATSTWKKQFSLFRDNYMPTNQAQCESFEQKITYYKKANGQQSFSQIANVTVKGKWRANDMLPCTVTAQPGSTFPPAEINPPSAGSDVYRIAQSIKVNGAWKTVSQGAQHIEPPIN